MPTAPAIPTRRRSSTRSSGTASTRTRPTSRSRWATGSAPRCDPGRARTSWPTTSPTTRYRAAPRRPSSPTRTPTCARTPRLMGVRAYEPLEDPRSRSCPAGGDMNGFVVGSDGVAHDYDDWADTEFGPQFQQQAWSDGEQPFEPRPYRERHRWVTTLAGAGIAVALGA